MSDKEIILKALDHIKHSNGHTDIKPFFAELQLNLDTQVRVKVTLEENGLANPHIYDAWKLMITTLGLKTKPNDLKEDGNLKRKRIDKDWRKTLITVGFGAILGFLFTVGLELLKVTWLAEPTMKIAIPPIKIATDTFYIRKDSLIIVTPQTE